MSVAVGWLAWGVLFALLVPRVRGELCDVVEYRWSRYRARRRVPRAQLVARSGQLDE